MGEERARPRVVLVEDDPEMVVLLTRFLKMEYRVEALESFSGVVEQLRSLEPDLILLDWELPCISGPDLCQAIKYAPELAEVPVLFLTGRVDRESEIAGLAAGAVDYISKPPIPQLLLSRVRNQLTMRAHLQAFHDRYLQEAGARRRAERGRLALTRLLESGLRSLSLRQQLDEALTIINTIDWLEVQSQGAIFLADDDGTLVLVAERGLHPILRQVCARVPPGHCLCGRAAREKRVVFADQVDERHEVRFPGMVPHGHYALPLKEGERLLGVLTVYLAPGHRPEPGEGEFMEDLGRTLSGLIARRLMEASLQVNRFELQESQFDVVRKLGLAAEYRDTETGMHVVRMAHFTRRIGEAAGLSGGELELLFQAAPMHDVGKIGIPDAILLKPGRLTEAEFAVMQEHTLIGERILTGDQELMAMARTIALGHHEKWSGGGYPHGRVGEEIPLAARICAIADVFDALTMERPYKKAWSTEEALALIRQGSGHHFDPRLVEAFFRVIPEILRLRTLYCDNVLNPKEQTSLIHWQPDAGISEFFPWREEYAVGIAGVDEHHRYLFDLLNRLQEVQNQSDSVVELGRALKALESYTHVHFAEEERMMAEYDFPGLTAHQDQHRRFIGHLVKSWQVLRRNPLLLGPALGQFLNDWLLNHILLVDREMAVWLQAAPR